MPDNARPEPTVGTESPQPLVPQALVGECDFHSRVWWYSAAVWQPKQAAIPRAAVRQLRWNQQRTGPALLDRWHRAVVRAKDAKFKPGDHLRPHHTEQCMQQ